MIRNMDVTLFIRVITCATVLGGNRILAATNLESKLIDHLFQNYSKQSRPVLTTDTAVVVQLGFELMTIVSLSERNQQIKNNIWMRVSWTNELLKWDPKEWNNIKKMKVSPRFLWLPDIVLYNEIDRKTFDDGDNYEFRIEINSNGKHYWLKPILLTSSCVIDVRDFPFDYQTCSMKFGSWSYDSSELDIIKDDRPLVTGNYIPSSEWELTNWSKKKNVVKYECCPNPFVDITFTFSLKRKSLYYAYNTISPCIILILIILFSFFLPTDCVERVTLIVTILLAFVVFLQLISEYLPKNSDTTSSLSLFYLVLMVESSCALVATCVVIFLHRRGEGKEAKNLPKWLRPYIGNASKCPQKAKESISYENKIELDEGGTQQNGIKLKNGTLVEASINSIRFINTNGDASEADHDYCVVSHANDKKSTGSVEQEEIAEQWQCLAKLLDRVFFVLFAVSYAIAMGILFS